MNNLSRFAATALATLLAAAPAAALAQAGSNSGSSETGASTPQSSMTTNTGSPGQGNHGSSSTMGQPGGTTGGTEQGQQLSQNDLQNVQQQLQQQGYYKNAKVDGVWGPQTRQAVKSFQQAKGLPASGQLDEQTLGALGVNHQGG